MNFLGMGMTELAVIFLVAFLALGPAKSIEMARATGKVLGDLRRTFNEVMAATTLDSDDLNVSDSNPSDSNPSGPNASRSATAGSGSQPKDSPGDSSEDSPVDFHGADR